MNKSIQMMTNSITSKDLFNAIKSDDREAIQEIINSGIDVNIQDGDGCTPLHYAVRDHSGVWTKILLDAGADVNIQDGDGCTPLHWAASSKIAKRLLDAGADVNARDADGETPLHGASDEETAKLLLDAGADVNVRNISGMSPVFTMIRWWHINAAKILLKAGADVTVVDINGNNLLHELPPRINEEFTSSRTNEYDELYMLDEYSELATILICAGTDIDAQNADGWTPLHKAAYYNLSMMIRLLLVAGADDTIKNKDGKTAYDVYNED